MSQSDSYRCPLCKSSVIKSFNGFNFMECGHCGILGPMHCRLLNFEWDRHPDYGISLKKENLDLIKDALNVSSAQFQNLDKAYHFFDPNLCPLKSEFLSQSNAAKIRRGLNTCYDCRGELSVAWMSPAVPTTHKKDPNFVAGASYCPPCIRLKAEGICNGKIKCPIESAPIASVDKCLDVIVGWMETWCSCAVSLAGLRGILTYARYPEDHKTLKCHGALDGVCASQSQLMPVKRLLTAQFGIPEHVLNEAEIPHIKLSNKVKYQLADPTERASGEAIAAVLGLAISREIFGRPTLSFAQAHRAQCCLDIMKGVATAQKLCGLASGQWPVEDLKKLCKRLDNVVEAFCDNYARYGYRGDGSKKTFVFNPANLIHAWQNAPDGLKAFNRLMHSSSGASGDDDDSILSPSSLPASLLPEKKEKKKSSKTKTSSKKASSKRKGSPPPSSPSPVKQPKASSSPRTVIATHVVSAKPTPKSKQAKATKKAEASKKRKSSPPANPTPVKKATKSASKSKKAKASRQASPSLVTASLATPPLPPPLPETPLPLIVMPTMATPTRGKFGEDPPHPKTVKHPAKKPIVCSSPLPPASPAPLSPVPEVSSPLSPLPREPSDDSSSEDPSVATSSDEDDDCFF